MDHGAWRTEQGSRSCRPVASCNPVLHPASSVMDRMIAYLLLTKPRIAGLVVLTGFAAVKVEGSLLTEPMRVAAVLLGIFLSAGAANALNQILDRDIDAVMERTRIRRPIPAGRVGVRGALLFGLACGIAGLGLLRAAGGALAALLAAGTIAHYVFVYTIWLKRRTPMNVVIGGAAGAAPPLIGWAAGAGGLSPVPLLMFLVVFLWSPAHFWALAVERKEDYALAGIPMLPVTAGERHTSARIAVYVALLLPAAAFLGIRAELGWPYLAGSTLLGIDLVHRVIRLRRRPGPPAAQALFSGSILYLAAVFALIVLSR